MIHYTKQERVEAVRRKMKKLCPVCWQDTVILVVVMTIALDMGLLLQPVGADDSHAALIFVAGVLLVARYTNGYLYGIAASLTAAIVVNYAFLSPYYQFELQEPGYLLTFATLFLVSIVTSTLTTHIKEQEEIRIEAERERLRANLLRAGGAYPAGECAQRRGMADPNGGEPVVHYPDGKECLSSSKKHGGSGGGHRGGCWKISEALSAHRSGSGAAPGVAGGADGCDARGAGPL